MSVISSSSSSMCIIIIVIISSSSSIMNHSNTIHNSNISDNDKEHVKSDSKEKRRHLRPVRAVLLCHSILD